MEFQSFLKFDDIDPSSLSPIMAQYYSFKRQYRDFIVLFRIGEFFETYFDDAIEFSNTTGVVLTRKKFKEMNVLMSGIPHKKLDIYLEKLIKNDFKVVVVEQVLKDGNLLREVSKIYTKGTLLDLELLNSKENNYLAALYKNENVYEICYSDISAGDVFVSSGNFEEIKCELARICPNELLVSSNLEGESFLYQAYKFEILDDKFYMEGKEPPSVNALLNYSKYILKNFTPRLEETKKYSIQKNLLIDFNTRKNLELTRNSYNNKEYGSMLWALDNCKTPMGKRLLVSILTTPLYDLEEIKMRQTIIEDFIQNKDIVDKLGMMLENVGDISRLTARLSNKTITPLEFLTLKDGLRILDDIDKIKKKFKVNSINKTIKDKCALSEFYQILDKTIEDNIDLVKSGNFIKNGASADLDFLILEYEKYLNEIKEYEKTLSLSVNAAIKIVKKSGNFSIEVPNSLQNSLPSAFRLVQKLKNTSRYVTDNMFSLEEKVFSLEAKIADTKNSILEELKNYSMDVTEAVREYSKELAVLDVFYSFYEAVCKNSLVKPEVVLNGSFEIEDGRHIAAMKIFEKYEPLSLKFEDSNFIMLTGANGSGKSTLLKEIGAMIVLAQIGSFVPSKFAKMPLVDKLFTILNVSDEFINKKSTHQAQMKEVSTIAQSATKDSVILLDEIGKNTSYKDGISILYGVIRYLFEEVSAKTVFATHYFFLKDLFEEIDAPISYLKIADTNGKRMVQKGVSTSSNGVSVARKENLPDKMMQYADKIMEYV